MSSDHEVSIERAVPARLSIVTLGVSDLVRATAFYKKLGWPIAAASTDEIVWFVTADSAIGLYPLDELATDAQMEPAPPGQFRGVILGLNVETTDLVDEVLEIAVAAGGRLVAPPEMADWGGYRGYFADPDDHVWEVLFHPYLNFAEDGSLDLG